MLTLRPVVCALMLSALLSGAAGTQAAVPALAEEFKLAPGSYTAAQNLPSLGLRAPPGTLHLNELRPVRGIHASDLRAYQESVPASYATRCVGVLDLTLVPASLNEAPALIEIWTRATDALVLKRDLGRATFLRGPAGQAVLSMVRPVAGAMLIASCPVAEVTQPKEAWTVVQRSASATLLAINWYGVLAVCADGQDLPLWNVRAFEGTAQLAARTPDGQRIAAVGWDPGGPALKVFAPPSKVPLSRAPLAGTFRDLFLSEDGQRATVFAQDNTVSPLSVVTSVDTRTGKQETRLVLSPHEQARAVSGDGLLVATTQGNTLRVREVMGGKMRWSANSGRLTTLRFARGDRWLVGLSNQGRVMSWQTAEGKRGPSVQAVSGGRTTLYPGADADQISLLNVTSTSASAPGEWSALTWTVGTGAPAPQGKVSGTGEEGVILEAKTGQLQAIQLCNVVAELPLIFP